jgi:hypothetical protein
MDAVLAGDPVGTGVTTDRAVLAFAGTDLPARDLLLWLDVVARRVSVAFVESMVLAEDGRTVEIDESVAQLMGGLFEMLMVGYELGQDE